MVNTSTNAAFIGNDTTKGLGSTSQYNQKVQIRVNGQNKYPRDGVTRPNQRLAKLTDVWGTCNSFPGSNEIYLSNAANVVAEINRIGNYDYFGCHIGEKVEDLQIDYSRENVATMNLRYNQQLMLNLFAEAQKQIAVGSGGYSVKYI